MDLGSNPALIHSLCLRIISASLSVALLPTHATVDVYAQHLTKDRSLRHVEEIAQRLRIPFKKTFKKSFNKRAFRKLLEKVLTKELYQKSFF